MNDITKARAYLNKRDSSLQYLTSFGLMYRAAESKYRDIKAAEARKDARLPGDFAEQEIEAALDYAVVLFMKRYNRLPPNVSDAFQPGITKEQKRDLAKQWANA